MSSFLSVLPSLKVPVADHFSFPQVTPCVVGSMEDTHYPRRSCAISSTSSSSQCTPNSPQTVFCECEWSRVHFRLRNGLTRTSRSQIEACLIIRGAFDQLGPGMRMENAGWVAFFSKGPRTSGVVS